MIRKVYSKRFILFFISLLASNEYFASQKYFMCIEDEEKKVFFTKESHAIAYQRDTHKCMPGIQINYRVYDNEFYNFICSVKTDNYRAYIFFRILENILSECSLIVERARFL